jgi:hypothetical protein
MLLINLATMYQVLFIPHILYVPYRITIVQSIYMVQGFPFAIACHILLVGTKMSTFLQIYFLKIYCLVVRHGILVFMSFGKL